MAKDKLYLVVAASGTGKDYAVDYLCKNRGFKKVTSRATREPRFIGEDTHKFVSDEQADMEFNREDVIAKTDYNNKRYYTLPEDLEGKNFYIIDVKGVNSMNKNNYYKAIFIKSPWYIRFKHMRKRGDKLLSILNRLWIDRKEFKGFKGDITFESSNEMINYFERDLKKCLTKKNLKN
ncbi:MAG: hypothetical protein ACRC7N_04920 [Clostridium sp.]